ncbi:polysaccharide biosynthesis tyrosine autokinase [Pseudarthrobacter sulfonivorans]|uniref:polysaccharide biosynthesis tyrosine autokinase n=1 Tax=Pseudarthrobacter sulfonivorans TaxID=121292 RepID=UPI0027816CBE|nr:polysaccharide biosynthesis tyrosine autokinase [Pseudarthrobacter sulfonivorans]MDQ0000521.1 capsular exopolysaccharide synthesis family protein [Pseudarthrobacter sulfonivorans]
MELSDYLRMFRRAWLTIAAFSLSGLLLGGAWALVTKPTYTGETQIFVAIQNSGSIQELQQGDTFSQARVQSYVQIINSPIVLQPVIDSLGLSTTAAELASRIKATSDPNTVLIDISVEDNSAVQAAAIAQGVADSTISAVDSLEKPQTGGSSPVKLSVIKPATAPLAPSAPNTRLSVLIGFVVGLGAGVATVIVRGSLDRRIRGEADLRLVTDAPLLGGISFDQDATKKPLLTQTPQQSPRAESFRQLRTNLRFANVAGQAKSVLITSSLPGEGKSTTATNLAIALSQAGQTVCLIDADLRRPMVGDYLGLARNAGLTTALMGAADVNDLLQRWGDNELYVLTSGEIPPNPSELLGSDAMQGLIQHLEDIFDHVIIDAPPLLPVTDAAVLAQHVGGIVLVVGVQKLKQQDLEKSLGSLQLVGSNLLGIVLNRLPAKGPDAYAYGYYQRDEEPSRRDKDLHRHATSIQDSDLSSDELFEQAATNSRRPASVFPSKSDS